MVLFVWPAEGWSRALVCVYFFTTGQACSYAMEMQYQFDPPPKSGAAVTGGGRACCRPSRLVNMARLYRPTVLGRVTLRTLRKHGNCASYAGDIKGGKKEKKQGDPTIHTVYGLSACCSSGEIVVSSA